MLSEMTVLHSLDSPVIWLTHLICTGPTLINSYIVYKCWTDCLEMWKWTNVFLTECSESLLRHVGLKAFIAHFTCTTICRIIPHIIRRTLTSPENTRETKKCCKSAHNRRSELQHNGSFQGTIIAIISKWDIEWRNTIYINIPLSYVQIRNLIRELPWTPARITTPPGKHCPFQPK